MTFSVGLRLAVGRLKRKKAEVQSLREPCDSESSDSESSDSESNDRESSDGETRLLVGQTQKPPEWVTRRLLESLPIADLAVTAEGLPVGVEQSTHTYGFRSAVLQSAVCRGARWNGLACTKRCSLSSSATQHKAKRLIVLELLPDTSDYCFRDCLNESGSLKRLSIAPLAVSECKRLKNLLDSRRPEESGLRESGRGLITQNTLSILKVAESAITAKMLKVRIRL